MSIDDNWGEALRKSAELEDSSDKSESRLKVRVTEGMLSGIVYDYASMALSVGNTTETYTLKTGGSGGTTVATVVVVYTTSDRNVLSSVTVT